MEQLINIIIVFVIIASVLKRLREVGETRENLGHPPEQEQDLEPGQASPSIPANEPASGTEVHPPTVEIFPLDEPLEPPREPVYRDVDIPSLEQAYDGVLIDDEQARAVSIIEDRIRESQEAYTRLALATEAKERKKPPPERKPTGALDLRFSGSAAINGIVMSEILGPPKGLREEEW